MWINYCSINNPQTHTYNNNSKAGGVCFRTDDNQPIVHFMEYASIFNSYNKKFCFSINLGGSEINNEYLNGIRQMQANGHEMMDHTPCHNTHCFYTVLNTSYYTGHPGVHHISGNKIELNYSDVDLTKAKRSGFVNINGNIVTSSNGIFSLFSESDCYLYFPTINELVYICPTCHIDPNNVFITDFWGNSLWLGPYQNIKFYNFDYDNIHISIDALKALGEESLRLGVYYNLSRPFVWIQPCGYFPHVYSSEIKLSMGDLNGYLAGDSDNEFALKVFNEFNPNNNLQFGMSWGSFREDIWDLNACKATIANGVAKHHVLIGHSHFTGGELLGGWTGFLSRTEQLIQWCVQNNISIRTYSEWADVLYNQTADPYENIIPPLNIDFDENDLPDGYETGTEGLLNKHDGAPFQTNFCYSINNCGEICSITGLGGIEKGKNDFTIWTKGSSGNFVEVSFTFSDQCLTYKFPAQTSFWKEYHLENSINGNNNLYIPDDVSLIDISIKCSDYSSGEVRISGMKLNKSYPVPIELSRFSAILKNNIVELNWQTITEVNNYGFDIERKIIGAEDFLTIWRKIGFIVGHGNSNSPQNYFFTDKNLYAGCRIIYRLKQIDSDGKFNYSYTKEVTTFPKMVTVDQNYPNPFNTITNLRFVLPEKENIKIFLYNIHGEKILTIIDEIKEIGEHNLQLSFDNLSSGIYFLKYYTQNIIYIKKIILIK